MNVTIQIPDDLSRQLAATGGDLSRRALEAFAVEEYRNGRLGRPAMRQLLGFATRDQLDGFLKTHAVVEDLRRVRFHVPEIRNAKQRLPGREVVIVGILKNRRQEKQRRQAHRAQCGERCRRKEQAPVCHGSRLR